MTKFLAAIRGWPDSVTTLLTYFVVVAVLYAGAFGAVVWELFIYDPY